MDPGQVPNNLPVAASNANNASGPNADAEEALARGQREEINDIYLPEIADIMLLPREERRWIHASCIICRDTLLEISDTVTETIVPKECEAFEARRQAEMDKWVAANGHVEQGTAAWQDFVRTLNQQHRGMSHEDFYETKQVEPTMLFPCGHMVGADCARQWMNANPAAGCPACQNLWKHPGCSHLMNPIVPRTLRFPVGPRNIGPGGPFNNDPRPLSDVMEDVPLTVPENDGAAVSFYKCYYCTDAHHHANVHEHPAKLAEGSERSRLEALMEAFGTYMFPASLKRRWDEWERETSESLMMRARFHDELFEQRSGLGRPLRDVHGICAATHPFPLAQAQSHRDLLDELYNYMYETLLNLAHSPHNWLCPIPPDAELPSAHLPQVLPDAVNR